MHIAANDCRCVEVSTDGTERQVPAHQLNITAADMGDVLAGYDPSSASSPPAATCRAIARPILDAIREAQKAATGGSVTINIAVVP
jgi:hypothetical protein